jgi:hypothetical protein
MIAPPAFFCYIKTTTNQPTKTMYHKYTKHVITVLLAFAGYLAAIGHVLTDSPLNHIAFEALYAVPAILFAATVVGIWLCLDVAYDTVSHLVRVRMQNLSAIVDSIRFSGERTPELCCVMPSTWVALASALIVFNAVSAGVSFFALLACLLTVAASELRLRLHSHRCAIRDAVISYHAKKNTDDLLGADPTDAEQFLSPKSKH